MKEKQGARTYDINNKLIALDDVTVYFLKNLRSLRKKLGYTQYYVAQQVDVKPSSIIGYEKGYGNPTLLTLIKLAEVLKFDISESINYKFFYGKIKKSKIREDMRSFALSFREISSIIGMSREVIRVTVRFLPKASIPCLLAILQVIEREKEAFAVRQHLTQKGM
ncbi:MAG: helix-turn-helix transcriptional regulator [Synergistaceae bacterium]|nr:helix-turn-helix transcriptional regulator [Synergistaceae bacterium]